MASSSLWPRFQKYFLRYDDLGFSIDISRMLSGQFSTGRRHVTFRLRKRGFASRIRVWVETERRQQMPAEKSRQTTKIRGRRIFQHD